MAWPLAGLGSVNCWLFQPIPNEPRPSRQNAIFVDKTGAHGSFSAAVPITMRITVKHHVHRAQGPGRVIGPEAIEDLPARSPRFQ